MAGAQAFRRDGTGNALFPAASDKVSGTFRNLQPHPKSDHFPGKVQMRNDPQPPALQPATMRVVIQVRGDCGTGQDLSLQGTHRPYSSRHSLQCAR